MKNGKKRCTVCRNYKEIEKFHYDASNPTGYQNHCKTCGKKLAKRNYWGNLEEARKKRREANRRRRERQRAEKTGQSSTEIPPKAPESISVDLVANEKAKEWFQALQDAAREVSEGDTPKPLLPPV